MTKKLTGVLGWSIVIVSSLYFIWDSAFNYFSYNKTAYGDYWPFAPFLITHIVGGMIALLIGPFQFIPFIRKNYVRVHHTIGKIYLVSIAISAPASLVLSFKKILADEKSLVFGTGLAGLAFAWIICSGMAYWAVRSRNFVQHREWMVRSFVVTCGFASFRLFYKILDDGFHVQYEGIGSMLSWACWSVPLMFTELILQAKKIHRGNVALSKKQHPVTH